MKTVTLDVRAPADAMGDFTQAWNGGKAQKSARISFATPELLWQVLTAERSGSRLEAGMTASARDDSHRPVGF